MDRHRVVVYLLAVAIVAALPFGCYFFKSLDYRYAPALPATWTHGGQAGWDFTATLQGHALAYPPMPSGDDAGDGGTLLGESFYGEYNAWTGKLDVSKALLQPDHAAILLEAGRHETGHALLDDIVTRDFGGGFVGYLGAMSALQSMRLVGRNFGGFIVSCYPEDLQIIYRAYIASPPVGNVGDDTDINMGEFFAESYANLIEGGTPDPNLLPIFKKYGSPGGAR